MAFTSKRRARRQKSLISNYRYNRSVIYAFVIISSFACIFYFFKSRANGNNSTELRLKNQGLVEIPDYVYGMKELKLLDIGGNKISSFSDKIVQLQNLEILFCSDNEFEVYPSILNQLPNLFMVSFKNNRLHSIPEEAFQGSFVNIHWLILTGNNLTKLPRSVKNLSGMRKFMLANNQLSSLPDEIAHMQDLELIRLANNKLEAFPEVLRKLPNLTWVALADNNFNIRNVNLPEDLRIDPRKITAANSFHLGTGASGIVRKKTLQWQGRSIEVASKDFKRAENSDGKSSNEILLTLEAAKLTGSGLMRCYGFVNEDPNDVSLIFEYLEDVRALGGPPSFETCTRDVYDEKFTLSESQLIFVLREVGASLQSIHSLDIIHGDLYAHNILVKNDLSMVKLSDFGAAWMTQPEHAELAKIWDLRAYRKLIEDLLPFAKTRPKYLTDAVNNGLVTLSEILENFE